MYRKTHITSTCKDGDLATPHTPTSGNDTVNQTILHSYSASKSSSLCTLSYDTIRLRLRGHIPLETPEVLKNIRESVDRTSGEYWYNGYLRNLFVTVNSNGISISGSFTKFAHGNNLESLSLPEVKSIIVELSDILHLKIENALVRRLDIAGNLWLDNPVTEYTVLFGNCGRIQKTSFFNGSSVIYRTSTHTLSFYNKTSEIKRHNNFIPDRSASRNHRHYDLQLMKHKPIILGNLPSPYCLRYEVQYMNHLPKQFQQETVTASLLWQPDFWVARSKEWHDYYFKIQKEREILPPHDAKTAREMVMALAASNLKDWSDAEKDSFLIRAKENRSKSAYQDFRQKFRELSSSPSITVTSERIDELNAKVQEVYENSVKGLGESHD